MRGLNRRGCARSCACRVSRTRQRHGTDLPFREAFPSPGGWSRHPFSLSTFSPGECAAQIVNAASPCNRAPAGWGIRVRRDRRVPVGDRRIRAVRAMSARRCADAHGGGRRVAALCERP